MSLVLWPGPIGGLSRITGFANIASISSGVAGRGRAASHRTLQAIKDALF
jgi:hypothetical protein